ncbi:MAG: hypothetical protein JOZ19_02940 [Rubrobacter sp.]|nr:hypothetical protein [Rubrobacter sp.]
MNLDEFERLKEFEKRFEGRLARGERRRLHRNRRPGLILVRILLIGACLLLVAVIVDVARFLAS